MEVSYMMIFSLLMGMTKHSENNQSDKFAISLQHLKKEVRDGVYILHADKHQSFYKSLLFFSAEVARHIQSIQIRKLVMFLQYLKKKLSQLFLFSIVIQNIQIFYGGLVMFSVTCYHIIFYDTTLKS